MCTGYRFGFPAAGAFTVGSVIITKHDDDWLLARPLLLQHEDRHCTQYAFLVGPVMLPLYFVSVGSRICSPATIPRTTRSSGSPASTTAATRRRPPASRAGAERADHDPDRTSHAPDRLDAS